MVVTGVVDVLKMDQKVLSPEAVYNYYQMHNTIIGVKIAVVCLPANSRQLSSANNYTNWKILLQTRQLATSLLYSCSHNAPIRL